MYDSLNLLMRVPGLTVKNSWKCITFSSSRTIFLFHWHHPITISYISYSGIYLAISHLILIKILFRYEIHQIIEIRWVVNVKYYHLQTKKTSEHFRAIWNVLKHSLPVSQIDFLKNGVEIWSWLALVVFIEEYRRSAKLQPQLLDSLLIIQRHQEELRVLLSLDRGHQREVLRESRIY